MRKVAPGSTCASGRTRWADVDGHRILRRLAAAARCGEEPAQSEGDHVAGCRRRRDPQGPDPAGQHSDRAGQRPGPHRPHDRIHRAACADAPPPAAPPRREPEAEGLGLLPHPCRQGSERRHHGPGRDGRRTRPIGCATSASRWPAGAAAASTFPASRALQARRSSMPSCARTDILVSLLPATPETDGIINRETIRKLSRKGPFGAPIVINAGRGRQQVAEDILAALDAASSMPRRSMSSRRNPCRRTARCGRIRRSPSRRIARPTATRRRSAPMWPGRSNGISPASRWTIWWTGRGATDLRAASCW